MQRIVVADDDERLRQATFDILGEAGYDVVAAAQVLAKPFKRAQLLTLIERVLAA